MFKDPREVLKKDYVVQASWDAEDRIKRAWTRCIISDLGSAWLPTPEDLRYHLHDEVSTNVR